MSKALTWILVSLIAVVAIFMIVSLVLASVHNVSIVGEWQRWVDGLKPAKEPAETAAKILLKL